MRIVLHIQRQAGPEAAPYQQEFLCQAKAEDPVSQLLTELNQRPELRDAQGRLAQPVDWECGCRQQACGACAMLINGYPRLACAAFVGQLAREAKIGDDSQALRVKLAPLSKFPLVQDLRVDRSQLFADIRRLRLWLTDPAVVDRRELAYQYQSASCLMCGCCAEICPNYHLGANSSGFVGAAVMNQAYRAASQTPPGAEHRRLLRDIIRAGQGHCSKTLSCAQVCPLELPLAYLVSRTNFLYLRSMWEQK